MFHQEAIGAFHAPFRKGLVEFSRSAYVRMAAEDQMGIGLEREISSEVFGESCEDLLLTCDQAAIGILDRRPGRRKVNTVERETRFQLHYFRGRRGRLHFHVRGIVRRASATVAHAAFHSVTARG